jgi:hypothetical protein
LLLLWASRSNLSCLRVLLTCKHVYHL